jgi:hypothetical protein
MDALAKIWLAEIIITGLLVCFDMFAVNIEKNDN